MTPLPPAFLAALGAARVGCDDVSGAVAPSGAFCVESRDEVRHLATGFGLDACASLLAVRPPPRAAAVLVIECYRPLRARVERVCLDEAVEGVVDDDEIRRRVDAGQTPRLSGPTPVDEQVVMALRRSIAARHQIKRARR